MSVRNRRRSPARRPPFKLPKRRILLVVEGAVTEKNYFEGMIAALRTTVVEFKVLGGVGVPMTIVETALKIRRAARERARVEKDQYLDYDETWCVFDVDQHPKIPEAVKLAEQHGIFLAISNPCFELWLWLHFADAPRASSAQELQIKLRQYMPDYRKHVRFAELQSGVESAIDRAMVLDQQAKITGQRFGNPSTGVWRLTRVIQSTHAARGDLP